MATGEIRQILLNKIAALSATLCLIEQLQLLLECTQRQLGWASVNWGAASINWGAANVNTSCHPVKKRIGKRLEWVA